MRGLVYRCGICKRPVPSRLSQSHHIIPQKAGAKADNSPQNLINLCSSCHHNLHRLAEMIMHDPRNGMEEASDCANIFYPKPHVANRVLEYATICAKAFMSGNVSEEAVISYSIDRETYIKLRVVAKDSSGSVAAFMREITNRIVETRYGKTETPAGSSDYFDRTRF